MDNSQNWYVIKCPAGHCEVVFSDKPIADNNPDTLEQWGPFTSQDEAIARRVGLIRAGKCQPQ